MTIHGFGLGASVVGGFSDAHKSAIKCGFPDTIDTYGLVSGLWTSVFAFGAFVGEYLVVIYLKCHSISASDVSISNTQTFCKVAVCKLPLFRPHIWWSSLRRRNVPLGDIPDRDRRDALPHQPRLLPRLRDLPPRQARVHQVQAEYCTSYRIHGMFIVYGSIVQRHAQNARPRINLTVDLDCVAGVVFPLKASFLFSRVLQPLCLLRKGQQRDVGGVGFRNQSPRSEK